MAQISILMPVYNAAEYLPACLESIRSQTFGDFELLMIDDGSADGSAEICEDYARREERFHVRHQENGGGAAARNAAIAWALETDSRYIVWVDADDLIAPDYLKFLYENIEKHPDMNMIQCGYTKDLKMLDRTSGQKQMPIRFAKTAEELLRAMINGEHGIDDTVLWNKIYRKEVYRDVSFVMTDEISGRMYDDIGILWKVYLNAGNCLAYERVLYFYRYVPDSVQHRKMTTRNLEFLPIYAMAYTACRKQGYEAFTDYLSERLLFFLANNLGYAPRRYENYRAFYAEAKQMFHRLRTKIDFRCSRPDLKLLYLCGKYYFGTFRLYGLLYHRLKG